MPADFISNLYVFILAGFVGFEVIKRVSPLLHTPLMSLTNALDAIVVVAAIIIAGRHETQAHHRARCHCGGGLVQQYGGRILDYRPHAAHVQVGRVEKIMTALALAAVSRFRLHCRSCPVHSVSQVFEFAYHGALGRSGRGGRRGLGGRRHAVQSRSGAVQVGPHSADYRRGSRHPAWAWCT